MITFSPPPGFRDVSEYTFGTGTRSLIVRNTQELGSPSNLFSVAKDYATQLHEYLGAKEDQIAVSEVKKRVDGAAYVNVEAKIGDPSHAIFERSAFILFGNGTSTQLSLTSAVGDAKASGEFVRLVQTVRPGPPLLDRQILGAAHPNQTKSRRAGAVTIDLPDEYREQTLMKFRDTKGTELSLKLEDFVAEPSEEKPKLSLFDSLAFGTDERGKSFAFEVVEHTRAGQNRQNFTTEGEGAALASQADRTISVSRQTTIGQHRVIVRVQSNADELTASILADEVSRSINAEEST